MINYIYKRFLYRAMLLKVYLKQKYYSNDKRQVEWISNEARYSFVTIVGMSHVSMLRRSLVSVCKNEKNLPPLIIAGDSNEVTDYMRSNFFTTESKNVQIVCWDTYLDKLDNKTRSSVLLYANHPRWAGFGKKLGFLLGLNATKTVVYSDSDMLWAGALISEVERSSGLQDRMVVSRDIAHAYDQVFLDLIGLDLKLFEAYNSGFMYLPKGILASGLEMDKMKNWHDCLTNIGCHTEQTIIACIAYLKNAQLFRDDQIEINVDDGGRWRGSPRASVRHYPGPKTLFWRDC